ncbi:MAG TPA: hypothetical protein VJN64_06980 [Terriglobales bacterium]|nr:hypothetical protein [Terriglobales bacterium]
MSNTVCNVTAPSNDLEQKLYNDQKQLLADDAAALITVLEQETTKLTGDDVDTIRQRQDDDEEEKSLKQSCPTLPSGIQKAIQAAAPATAAPSASSPSNASQATVTPSGGLDFDPQTIGTTSDAKSVTVANNSGKSLDLFVWYGAHLTNFKVTDNTCDTVTPNQGNCTFKVTFAPRDMHARDEPLRVVDRNDWERIYENTRLAYQNQTELLKKASDLQAKVENASIEINKQRIKLKVLSKKDEKKEDANAVLQFCNQPPTIMGRRGTQLIALCKDLRDANDHLTEVREAHQRAIAGGNITEEDVNKAANDLRDKALALIPLSGTPNHWKYPLTRGVVGLDLSAVSSQTVKQAYFVDFDLLAPFRFFANHNDALEDRWWFWLNPRITSLPKAADFSSLSTISETGSFFTNFSSKGSVSDIAQGFDVNGGLEFALLKPRDGIPWWGEYVNTQARLGISVIGGAGMSTPFSVENTDIISQVNQGICDAFKAQRGETASGPAGLVCTFPSGASNPVIVAPNPAPGPNAPATVQDQFIDFFTPEQSRFFRRYYAGFRLKTYFFSPDVQGDCNAARKRCDAPYDIFPGIIDLTVGQDEAVTAGKFRKLLLRAEGVYPLPFYPGLHIFGSVYTSWAGNNADPPFNFFAVNSPANGASNDFNTFRFPTPLLNRDYFRIGIGLDLIQVFKKDKGGQPSSSTKNQSDAGQSGAAPSSGSNQ